MSPVIKTNNSEKNTPKILWRKKIWDANSSSGFQLFILVIAQRKANFFT